MCKKVFVLGNHIGLKFTLLRGTVKKSTKNQQVFFYFALIACVLTASLGELLGFYLIVFPLLIFIAMLLISIAMVAPVAFKMINSEKNQPVRFFGFFCLTVLLIRIFLPLISRYSDDTSYKVWDLDLLTFGAIANSIETFGGIQNNLGIVGDPIRYHTAPSFVIASLKHMLPVDIVDISIMVEILFSLTLILLVMFVVGTFFKTFKFATTSALITLNLPFFSFRDDFRIFISDIISTPSFTFDAMLGVLVGINVLLVYLIVPRTSLVAEVFLSFIIMICLIETKPQFIPLIAVIMVWRLVLLQKSWMKSLFTIAFLGIAFLLYSQSLSSSRYGIQTTFEFGLPAVDFSAYVFRIAKGGPLVLAVFLIIFLMTKRFLFAKLPSSNSLYLVFCGLALVSTFQVLTDLIQISIVTPKENEWIDLSSLNANDEQLLYPISLVALLFMVIVFVDSLSELILLALIPFVLFFSISTPFLIIDYLNENRNTEDFADLSILNEAIRAIPSTGLILTNDFAYPAKNYARSNQGDFLNLHSENPFYLTMPANVHQSPLLTERLANVNRFFGSEFSTEHVSFIEENDVDFLLISRRCDTPVMLDEKLYTYLIYSNSGYLIFDLRKLSLNDFLELSERTAMIGQKVMFGISSCSMPSSWTIQYAAAFRP